MFVEAYHTNLNEDAYSYRAGLTALLSFLSVSVRVQVENFNLQSPVVEDDEFDHFKFRKLIAIIRQKCSSFLHEEIVFVDHLMSTEIADLSEKSILPEPNVCS